MGEGTTFWERKRKQVIFEKCGKKMAASCILQHVASIHGRILSQNREVDTRGWGRETYRVSSPRVLTLVYYLVEGGPARDHTSGRLWEHFLYLHWKAQVAIVKYVPPPLPWCPIYGMYMHAESLIMHQKTDRCNQATEIRMQRRNAEISQRAGDTKFSLYDRDDDPLV